jgi:hypothetical protein
MAGTRLASNRLQPSQRLARRTEATPSAKDRKRCPILQLRKLLAPWLLESLLESAYQIGSFRGFAGVGRHQAVIIRQIFDGTGKTFVEDGHSGANGDPVKDLNHVAGTHPNTAVARFFAQAVFRGGAVNIDAPVIGIFVRVVQTAQPNDAAHDRVPAGRVGG